MAGGGSYQDDEDGAGPIAGINVTPLVDVTLILLIIFMVTARFIVTKAIPVQSPKATSGEEVRTTLGLTLDASRQLYLNGEPVSNRQTVESYLQRVVAAQPSIQAIITADARIPHGDVIELVDMVRVAGVVNFALTVEQKEPDPPEPP